MTNRRSPTPLSVANFCGTAAGACVCLVGGLVLCGWVFDVGALKSVVPGLIAMKVNSAVAFVLAGIALSLVRAEGSDRQPSQLAAHLCASAVALIATLTLGEYLFGWDLGIDQLLFTEPVGRPGSPTPGRMAPQTAVSFLALGVALLVLDTPRGWWIAQSLSLAAGLGALVALVGYVYHQTALYVVGPYIGISLHTALSFVILSAGILCARPSHGLMALIVSDTAGGMMVRRLLPVVISAPVLLGWLIERRSGESFELGASMHAVSLIAVFGSLILWNGRSLYRSDTKRRRAEEGVNALEQEVTGRKRAEEALRESERELALKSRVAKIFLTVPEQEMYTAVLRVVLDAMQSEEGVFGYLDEDGALVCPSMTRVWDRCQVPGKSIRFPRDEWAGTWGHALSEKRSVYSNQPGNVPEGHIPIRNVLVVPILFQDEAIGHFEIANRATDYTDADKEFVERLAGYLAPVLRARLQRDTRERERNRAEEEIRRLNAELEARVAQGTTELAAALKEIEGISYTVSHNLRAPLRHLDGFSKLLLKRAGAQLDATATHYVHTIIDATATMRNLVEGLLGYLRAGRMAPRTESVDVKQLVIDVQQELAAAHPDRRITWVIGAVPAVETDPGLLRLVFVSLLSNAIKFTAPRAEARIEIGVLADGVWPMAAGRTPEPGRSGGDHLPSAISHQRVFYVRDNGVGFDPRYVRKLFGVFQRLHSDEAFAGTGIGLATARRIVTQLGGRIWAEGEVDRGASFYFTLRSAAGAVRSESATALMPQSAFCTPQSGGDNGDQDHSAGRR